METSLSKAMQRALHTHLNRISLPLLTFKLPLYLISSYHTNASYEITTLDDFTLVKIIRNCTNYSHVSHGKQLHSYILRSGFASNVYISTSLVHFYAKVVSLYDAHKLFEEMPQPNVVSWNAVISGYVRWGKLWEALSLFLELNQSEVQPDAYSFTSALSAAGQLMLLHFGMCVHSKIIVFGMESSNVVANCLIDFYGQCSSEFDAIRVFEELKDKDVISWNSVISSCARNRRLELALNYFDKMPCPETLTYNEIIDGMSKFGNINEAVELLKRMPNPNSSSWNTIISGYVVRNRAEKALDFFAQMHSSEAKMDGYTFSSILSGIAFLSALRWGSLVHCCTIKHGWVHSIMVGSALVDMYSKCGKVEVAETLFKTMSEKNIVTWNALISGLAHNGESHKVIKYFEELKGAKGLKPDDITFLNILAACSHSQMPLEKAYKYLMSMMNDYGIEPRPEHISSIIRLMGHHGQLSMAEKMIYDLRLGSCSPVWRALLGACKACGDLDVGKVAARKLMELENDETGYVFLSNINKDCGNWRDANQVWEEMRGRGVMKEAGFSWIEKSKL